MGVLGCFRGFPLRYLVQTEGSQLQEAALSPPRCEPMGHGDCHESWARAAYTSGES